MKKSIFTILAVAGLTMAAQAQKFGHINTQELLTEMPEYKTEQSKIDSIAKQRQKGIEYAMQKFQEKQAIFEKEQQECIDLGDACDSKEYLELEYQVLLERQQKIEQMQASAQQDLAIAEQEGMSRLVELVKKAAEKVADEKGIIYVFDSSTLIVAKGEDLNDEVKAILMK